jgi:hypothetical protein
VENNFGFVGQMLSVAAIQLCNCSKKAATDNNINEPNCVLIKIYLHTWQVKAGRWRVEGQPRLYNKSLSPNFISKTGCGQIGAMGCSWLTFMLAD